MPQDVTRQLVPNRECGECHACCQYLKIDEPQLQKLPNVLCSHWNGGCGIYVDRPPTCRGFFCGWRVLSHLPEEWRPDRSNILLRFVEGDAKSLGVDINLLGTLDSAMTKSLLEYIAARVTAGYKTFLVLPGPPGHSASKILLNNRMGPAVTNRNYGQALDAFEEAVRVCRNYPTSPATVGANSPDQTQL